MFWGKKTRPTAREAILKGVREDNVRLRQPGFTHRMSTRRPRRERWLTLAAAILVAGASLHHLLKVAEGNAPAPQAVAQPAPSPAAVAKIAKATPDMVTDAAPVTPLKIGEAGDNVKDLMGLSTRTIMIDAGHGGRDPGAVSKGGLREKDITLDVAARLKRILEQQRGYQILMSRHDDHFVPLHDRAKLANEKNVDLFISIHVNYMPGNAINAVETYYFGNYQDAATRELAKLENRESGYSISEFEKLGRDMQDRIKLQESMALAKSIQGSLLKNIRAQNERVLDTGVRPAPFIVLYAVKSPSILAEIGSLSSPEAEARLRREDYREQIAGYLAAGITNYLNNQSPSLMESKGGHHHEKQNHTAVHQ